MTAYLMSTQTSVFASVSSGASLYLPPELQRLLLSETFDFSSSWKLLTPQVDVLFNFHASVNDAWQNIGSSTV